MGLVSRLRFKETEKSDWQVGYTVAAATTKPTMEWLSDSLRILGGVFQAVIEFLTIRQPQHLLFEKEHQDLIELFEAYLNRPNTDLTRTGYDWRPAEQVSPIAPFLVEKMTPSDWRNC